MRYVPAQISKRNGFTLLELLIALVIVSMIMTAAFGALRIGSRSWEAGIIRSDAIEEMQAFAELLRRQIGQTLPLSFEDEAGERIAFEGQPYEIRFVAPAPFESGRAGMFTYTLIIDRAADGSSLRLAYDPYDPGADSLGGSSADHGITLATTFTTSSLEYFGAVATDAAESWRREWPDTAELFPRLVRISFGSDEDDGAWPDLVLPLRSRQAP